MLYSFLLESKDMESTGLVVCHLLGVPSEALTEEKKTALKLQNAWDHDCGDAPPLRPPTLVQALYETTVTPTTILQTDNGLEFSNKGTSDHGYA